MNKQYLSFVLAGLLVFSGGYAPVFAQTKSVDNEGNVGKIKAEVLKRSTGEKKPVRVKMLNGSKLKGYISGTAEDSFTLVYSETQQSTEIAYRDVKQVEGRGLPGGAKIGIIVGAVAAGVLVVLNILFDD